MTYLRKLLKKVGIMRILEIHPFPNSYLIELMLIKIWTQLDLEEGEQREEIIELIKEDDYITKNGCKLKYMTIYHFSNMEISNIIINQFKEKEEELILLLIYEFLKDLLLNNPNISTPKDNPLTHFSSHFTRFIQK